MISFHPDPITDWSRLPVHVNGWQIQNNDTVDVVARLANHNLTSPCVWRGGVRGEKNFSGAHWLALDFDTGTPDLDQAVAEFAKYRHVIGTTKSHQKEKGNAKACDRFRVFLRLDHWVSEPFVYRQSVAAVIRRYGADPSTSDCARLFYPCRDIVSKGDGELFQLPKIETPIKPRRIANFAGDRIPRYVQEWLSHGGAIGEKNKLCFRIGAILTACGMDESTIVDTIMSSAIPINQTEQVYREVVSAVRNGARRERNSPSKRNSH